MATFQFRLNHPEHGDYYTGVIGAEDRQQAQQILLERARDRYDAYKDRDDRVAVDPEGVTVHLSEVKTHG